MDSTSIIDHFGKWWRRAGDCHLLRKQLGNQGLSSIKEEVERFDTAFPEDSREEQAEALARALAADAFDHKQTLVDDLKLNGEVNQNKIKSHQELSMGRSNELNNVGEETDRLYRYSNAVDQQTGEESTPVKAKKLLRNLVDYFKVLIPWSFKIANESDESTSNPIYLNAKNLAHKVYNFIRSIYLHSESFLGISQIKDQLRAPVHSGIGTVQLFDTTILETLGTDDDTVLHGETALANAALGFNDQEKRIANLNRQALILKELISPVTNDELLYQIGNRGEYPTVHNYLQVLKDRDDLTESQKRDLTKFHGYALNGMSKFLLELITTRGSFIDKGVFERIQSEIPATSNHQNEWLKLKQKMHDNYMIATDWAANEAKEDAQDEITKLLILDARYNPNSLVTEEQLCHLVKSK